jgi:hypothetical protein
MHLARARGANAAPRISGPRTRTGYQLIRGDKKGQRRRDLDVATMARGSREAIISLANSDDVYVLPYGASVRA